ncbi:MAG: hypothetical protein ACRD16_15255 [Thermoanaerobaculia bacterium]
MVPPAGKGARLRWPTPRRLLEYLVAILAGNAVYFLILSPLLPEELRHRPFREDWGLLVDFVVCVLVYGLLRRVLPGRSPGSGP